MIDAYAKAGDVMGAMEAMKDTWASYWDCFCAVIQHLLHIS